MTTKNLLTMILMTTVCLLTPTDTFAQSLLQNGDFGQVNSQGSYSIHTSSSPQAGGGGQSGAEYWTTWAGLASGYTLTTSLVPSTFPNDPGNMLVVETDGGGGIVQVFDALHAGPEEATACVWLYVESGAGVCVGIGDGGNTHCSMTLTEKGKWERITVSNGISPANEIVIYATGPSRFYVTYAAVFRGPSWDQEGCCSPEEFGAGF